MIIINKLYLIPTQFWFQAKGITSTNTTVRLLCEDELFRIEFETGERLICLIEKFKTTEVTLSALKTALSSWCYLPDHFSQLNNI